MCGIFGIIEKNGSNAIQSLVKDATQKLSHRGPDDEGFYFQENIGLGHNMRSFSKCTRSFYKA